jgi:glucose/arabinose dehydrogenase
MTPVLRVLFIAMALCITGFGTARAASAYQTGGDCDGVPRVAVKTAPGLCLGLVAEHLGFTRGVAVIGDDVFVADMGGWRKGHGKILRLGHGGRDRPVTLLDKLDEPNALLAMPDGKLLVGMLGGVFDFDPRAANPQATIRELVINLPGEGLHPLPALALAADGALFVNVGSATDHCEGADRKSPNPCPETLVNPPRATIIRVPAGAANFDARQATPFARGLRNSLGLALLPSGQLIAAVNARDNITAADPSLPDENFPHDTLDWIEPGADYGWPYCFDDNRPSPEYPRFDCATKHAPTRLLPAHAAPLNLLLYRGALPGLAGHLLITYHGYRATGHRIVALALDPQGQPSGQPVEIVFSWNAIPNVQPEGAPVALAELKDGSVLITEDHNGTMLRLSAVGK